jgi:hypothetical protein
MRPRYSPSEARQFYPGECTAAESVGDFVYIYGPMNGDRVVVRACDSTVRAKMPAWAMIVQKSSDTECILQRWGMVTNVYTGLTPGELYHVDQDGELGSYARPGFAQIVAQAIGTDELWLTIEPMIIKLLAS